MSHQFFLNCVWVDKQEKIEGIVGRKTRRTCSPSIQNYRHREHKFVDKAGGRVMHESQFQCGEKVGVAEVHKACNHFLNNHAGAGDKKIELGSMHMVGNKFDECLGCKNMCVRINAENTDATNVHEEVLMGELAEQMDHQNILQQC